MGAGVKSLGGAVTDSMRGSLSLGAVTGIVRVLLGVVEAKRVAVKGKVNDFDCIMFGLHGLRGIGERAVELRGILVENYGTQDEQWKL